MIHGHGYLLRGLRPLRGLRFLLGAGLLVTALSGMARAGEQADGLLKEGIRQYSLAQFEQALSTLRRAEAAAASRITRAQVHLYQGLCQAELGNVRRARRSFAAALDLAPHMWLDPRKFKRSACHLFDKVRKSRRGKLRVEADRAGAVVKLDGKDVGTVPFEGEVSAGLHRLDVLSADGSLGYSGKIQVQPRVLNRLVLALKPLGGRLSVQSSPRGAEIRVDGELTSLTPANDLPLKPGMHDVTVSLSGYQEQTRVLELRAGEQVRLDLELRPKVSRPAVPARAKSTAESNPPPGLWSRSRLWTWVALGAAGASAITAGAVWGSAKSDHEEYISTKDLDRFNELQGQIDDKLLASNIMWGVTGVLAATATVLFFLEGRHASRRSPDVGSTAGTTYLMPVMGPTPGMMLEGHF